MRFTGLGVSRVFALRGVRLWVLDRGVFRVDRVLVFRPFRLRVVKPRILNLEQASSRNPSQVRD